jgi:hypothetical protein
MRRDDLPACAGDEVLHDERQQRSGVFFELRERLSHLPMSTARATISVVIAAGVAAAMVTNACMVSRPSDNLKCGGPSDCTGNRFCENGYCVVDYELCPRQCTACDITASPPICTIDLSGDPDDSVSCPSDMHCDITCHDRDSCGSISCTNGGASCNIACLSHNACGNVTCGAGACNVMCTDTTACGTVNCTNSCACDVTCAQGDCGTLSCPKVGSGYCTTSGSNNQPCTSAISGCSHC